MSTLLDSQKLHPNAKLNLYLEIIGQQANGYHLLETIMAPISLYDEMDVKLFAQGETVVKTLNSDIKQEDNIVYKAIKAIQKEFHLEFGIEVLIKKGIPSGAGLGGGSSDAGFMIKYLNDYFQFASLDQLIPFSAKLGADVPFFLINKPAFCEGIGDIITEISIEKFPFYLYLPDYHVNTAKIFQKRKDYLSKDKLFGLSLAKDKMNIWHVLKQKKLLFFNRLEASIQEIEPDLYQQAKQKSQTLYLTGSGSTFYSKDFHPNLKKVHIL